MSRIDLEYGLEAGCGTDSRYKPSPRGWCFAALRYERFRLALRSSVDVVAMFFDPFLRYLTADRLLIGGVFAAESNPLNRTASLA